MAKAVVLAVVAVLGSVPAATASPVRTDASVLAIDRRTPGRERLVLADPLTLRRRGGRGVDLAGHGWPYAFTADRSRLVLGRWESPSLLLVDARELRALRAVPLDGKGRVEIRGVAWLGEQIVVLVERRARALALLRVDPAEGRVVASLITRWTADVAATHNRLVALLAPRGRIGPARLLVVTAENARTVTLAGISAGVVPARRGRPSTFAIPGLAVSRREPRAWVIGARRSAEVDLQTLAVRYRGEPRHLSLQKGAPMVGSARDAQWLSSGELVVTGWDSARNDRGRIVFAPSGLRLLEPTGWTDRLVQPRALLFYVGPNQLLTIATGEPECAAPILTAYTLAGTQVYRVCEERATGEVEFAGRYARLGRVDGRVAVVDLDSGAVVARMREVRLDPLETGLVREF